MGGSFRKCWNRLGFLTVPLILLGVAGVSSQPAIGVVKA